MENQRRPASFGGMEKAFSAKTMMRHDGYFGFEEGDTIRLPWKVPETTEQNRKHKRTRRSANRVLRPWDLLPDDLVVSITSRLNLIELFAVGGICQSWRSPTIQYQKYIMKLQQPLVLVKSRYAKKAYFLCNIFDGKEYKSKLPNLIDRKFMGLSCGYLVTREARGFWLLNVMTKQELCFPAVPECLDNIQESHSRHVIFKSTRGSNVFMAIVCTKYDFLFLLNGTGGSWGSTGSWVVYPLPGATAGIADFKIFNGKMYVLTCDARIGEFHPTTCPAVNLHKSNISVDNRSNTHRLQLVSLNDSICMVICRAVQFNLGYEFVSLYELDQKMEWVMINDMGPKSLFVSRFNSAVVDTTGWGAGNCVCVLEPGFRNRWSLYRLNDGQRLAKAPVAWNGPHFHPHFWYFPEEHGSISLIDDKYGL